MTKPITCLAAMMLIDDGKLALNDPLSKYIPSFAKTEVGEEVKRMDGTSEVDLEPPMRPITILDLMRHTSGITYDYIGANWVEKAYQDANIFAGAFRQQGICRAHRQTAAVAPARNIVALRPFDRRARPRHRGRSPGRRSTNS